MFSFLDEYSSARSVGQPCLAAREFPGRTAKSGVTGGKVWIPSHTNWLTRQLDAKDIGNLRRDNCVVSVADFAAAQKLLDPSEAKLLAAIASGEHLIGGFHNRGRRRALLGDTDDAASRRRQAGQITRRLALLRAHGPIKKIPHTLRYRLTTAGAQTLPALIALPNMPLAQRSAA